MKYHRLNTLSEILKKNQEYSFSIQSIDLSLLFEFQEFYLPRLEQLLLLTEVDDDAFMEHVSWYSISFC